MRRLLAVALVLVFPVAASAQWQDTTRAKLTLGAMFTQSGSFGPPPFAADPFACSAAVTAERTVYYNTATHSIWFCNASAWTELGASSGITSPVSGDFVWLGKQTFGTAGDAADSVRVGETAGAIVFEGSGADGNETTLGVTNPTADIRYNLPNAAAGTYSVLTTAVPITLAQGGTGLTTAADDTVPVSSGTAWVASAVPACTDVTGNHLNYDAATNAFSCGTSSSGGITSPVAGDFVWTGKGTWGSAADAANSVRVGETAGAVVFEGATLDGNELTLDVADPGADVTVTVPATAGTLATLGNVAQTFANNITAPNVIASTSLQAIATGSANSTTIDATGITFEGSTADAHETVLAATQPTADATFNLPAPVAGTYNILTTATPVTLAQGGTGLATAADDTVLLSSGSAWVASAVPDCVDTTGNHLNYTAATNAFSCGTSGTATAVSDATFRIQDNGDATKQVAFEASGITTGTTRTLTIPNGSGAVVLSGIASDNIILKADQPLYLESSYSGGLNLGRTAWVPDGPVFSVGTVASEWSDNSGSLRIVNRGEVSAALSNGPCGTSPCADATIIIFSHNSAVAEYLSLQHNGSNAVIQTGTGAVTTVSAGNELQVGSDSATAAAQKITGPDGLGSDKVGGALTIEGGLPTGTGAAGDVNINAAFSSTTGSTEIASVQRAVYRAKRLSLTDNTATTVMTVAVPAGAACSGMLEVEASTLDATNVQSHHSHVGWAIAQVVAGGTYATDIDEIDSNAVTSGTYADTWAIVTGTNTAAIQATFNSSLDTATSLVLTAISNSGCVITFP
jgi:hypothetical protein